MSKFVDLAPTSSADNAGIYFEALNYATNNDEVLNIALTGPYGSGKSSVIKSFLAKYPRATLQLSLASFLPDGDVPGLRVTKQEIERSILQQILYGVDADKLPFSRFKRIKTPKRISFAITLFITAGLGCAWYVFSKQSDVISGKFFEPLTLANWFNYLCAAIVAVFAWKIIYSVYTTSFGLSLKSVSLKDVQIATANEDKESILNRHLDEILYFFQSTDYDLVVIEDLDRFENPDIFVTLREINGLINANEGIKRRVRFLYALRDDIFANTDRTKFFEFIVPVIPVINHSNSIDKVLEQGKRINLDKKLNRQFVREVSRYLTDVRLIRNIFNEYVVYAANLKADSDGPLDPNKLLAILIYKNVIPRDFAALHRQEGALSKVLGRYEQYVSKIEGELRSEISLVENTLARGESQSLRDKNELRKVYAMAVLQQVPSNILTLLISNEQIPLGQLADSPRLEEVLAQPSINVLDIHGSRRVVALNEVEATVDPTRTFADRQVEVGLKSAAFKRDSEQRLREINAQLASLRTRRFNEVVRESADLISQIFAEVGENKELLKYLILEGYLDDTYYQYISLFHGGSGRLSPNDNGFLLNIRAYNNPTPDFPLDNIDEVIASMRADDFGRSYVLNRLLVDHLLSNVAANLQRVADAADFMAANFALCGPFFRSYYAKGVHVEKLIQTLAARWPSFTAVALDGTDGASHAARIVAYAPEPLLKGASNAAALRLYLSQNTRQVLAEGVDFDMGRLRSLAIEADNIGSIVDFPSTLSFVAQEGLYRISIENIGYVLHHVVGWHGTGNLERRHLSTVNEANDPALRKRIDRDFPVYVRDVLLALKANTNEGVSAILEVLVREDVAYDLRAEFLKRQTATFPSIQEIPEAFHQIVLEGGRIEATWENCLAFMTSNAYNADLLTAYLQTAETAAALSKQSISGDDASRPLRKFVIWNDALDAKIYRSYVRQLPRNFAEFPAVDASKIRILIDERKITFTPVSFGKLEDDDLKISFLAKNFSTYEAEQSQYAVDDAFRAKLLRTGITDAQKLKLIDDMDESYVAGAPSVAADIGPLLEKSSIEKHHSFAFVKAVIVNSRSNKVQISLFNKLHSALSVSEVREVLLGLSGSFKDIATFGRSPKIENSDVNQQFAAWLKERKIISSFGDTLLGDEIKINTFKKAS